MPQYIPGNEQLLAPAFAQITESLVNLINPNKKFQDAVLAAISKDPSLIQKFADFEASSPGILKNLGIPALGGVKPSVEAQATEATREPVIEAKKLEAGLDVDRLKAVTDLLKKRPDVNFDMALRLVTGETQAQRTVSEEKAKQAPIQTEVLGLQRDVAKAAVPGELAKADLATRGFQAAQQMLTDGVDVTLDKVLNNEYTAEQLMGIAQTPLWDVLKQQMQMLTDQLRLRYQAFGDNQTLERLQLAHAFQVFTEAGAVGSVPAARNYIYGGGAAIAAGLLDKPEASLSPEERELVAIHKGLGAARALEDQQNKAALNSKLTQAIANYRLIANSDKVTDAQKQMGAQAINNVLVAGRAPFSVEYGATKRTFLGIDRFAPDKKDLIFKDAQGNPVDISVINAWMDTTTETPTKPKFSPAIQSKVDYFTSLSTPGEKEAALAKWRAELKDYPAQLAELEAALGVKK